MKNENHTLVAIHIHNRVAQVPKIQQLLTEYGCNIKTRLGIHEVNDQFCSANGLILLEMVGDSGKISEFQNKMKGFQDIETKTIVFEHKE